MVLLRSQVTGLMKGSRLPWIRIFPKGNPGRLQPQSILQHLMKNRSSSLQPRCSIWRESASAFSPPTCPLPIPIASSSNVPVLERAGRPILSTHPGRIVSKSPLMKNGTSSQFVHSEGIDAALNGSDGSGFYRNYAGVPVVGVYRWVDNQHLALVAEMSQEEAIAPARDLALTIFYIGDTPVRDPGSRDVPAGPPDNPADPGNCRHRSPGHGRRPQPGSPGPDG